MNEIMVGIDGALISWSFLTHTGTGEKVCNRLHPGHSLTTHIAMNTMEGDHICEDALVSSRVKRFLFAGKRGKEEKGEVDEIVEEWERSGENFTTSTFGISGLSKDELIRLAAFCSRSSLETNAMKGFRELMQDQTGLHIVFVMQGDKYNDRVVGFAIYKHSPGGNEEEELSGVIDEKLESEGWWPENPDMRGDWKYIITRLLEQYGSIHSTEEEELDDPKSEDSPRYKRFIELLQELKHQLYTGSDNLLSIVEDLAVWMLNLRLKPATEHSDSSEVFIDIVCADPEMAGYGILKGILRYLIRVSVNSAVSSGNVEAVIRLIPVNKSIGALYRSLGFKDEDGGTMTSGNLMDGVEGLDVEEEGAHSRKKRKTKKGKK